jgi:hypothetical protein
VPGVDQRLRFAARQRLDPERARQAQQGAVDAVGPQRLRAGRGVLRAEVERRLRLAGQPQHPTGAAAVQGGRLGAAREGRDERLGPEVLVDVDAGRRHCGRA